MQRKYKVGIGIIAGILALVFVLWVVRFIKVDKCLDSGGRWNYENSICEYAQK